MDTEELKKLLSDTSIKISDTYKEFFVKLTELSEDLGESAEQGAIEGFDIINKHLPLNGVDDIIPVVGGVKTITEIYAGFCIYLCMRLNEV